MAGSPSPSGLLAATLAEVLALTATDKAVTPAMLKGLHCAFGANRTSDQTSMTGGAYNKVSMNNEVLDSHGYYDPATNFRFTPLVAGTYFAWLLLNSTTGADGPQARIYKNGAVALQGSYNPAVSGLTQAFGFVAMNGSTDYLEAFVFLATGVTTVAAASGQTCQFGAIRIGN